LVGTVAGFKSQWWPVFNRVGCRLRRNPHWVLSDTARTGRMSARSSQFSKCWEEACSAADPICKDLHRIKSLSRSMQRRVALRVGGRFTWLNLNGNYAPNRLSSAWKPTIQDPPERLSINITVHSNAPAAAKLDRHDTCLLARPWCRFHGIRWWQRRRPQSGQMAATPELISGRALCATGIAD
jgi:hypothetical protein